MESHRFLSLDCSGALHPVGESEDHWTESELDEVMPRVESLATDPARGSWIADTGLEEAAVALTAENLEVFESLRRETSGHSEFQDESGRAWDVKSPVSPPPNQGWNYSPHHHLEVVKKDLETGDRILLNLSRVTPEDAGATITVLQENLPCDFRDDLLILAPRRDFSSE